MAACDIWSGKRSSPIGDDFWVTDEQGNEAFLVDGKALRLRQTFVLKDRSGAIVATVRKRLLAVRDSMDIERGGTVIATVKKAVFSPLHHRSVVELPGGGELEAVVDPHHELACGEMACRGEMARRRGRVRAARGRRGHGHLDHG